MVVSSLLEPRWSAQEIERLRLGYQRREPTATIAADLGRAEQAIRSKAHRLGFARPQRWRKVKPETRRYLTKIRSLTTSQLAYLAGIIDGEGYIKFRENGRWLIEIGNTHRGIIDWLQECIGGCVYAKRRYSPKHRACWVWHLASEALVVRILRRCLPFLIIKRDRALEALASLDPTLPAHRYLGQSKRAPG